MEIFPTQALARGVPVSQLPWGRERSSLGFQGTALLLPVQCVAPWVELALVVGGGGGARREDKKKSAGIPHTLVWGSSSRFSGLKYRVSLRVFDVYAPYTVPSVWPASLRSTLRDGGR